MQPHQPTLAEKLGTTRHVSPLLLKLKNHGLTTPKEIAAAAIDRGCRHYAPFAEGLHKDVPGITDEELAIALLSPCHPYEPQLIRIGSQMLSGDNSDPKKLKPESPTPDDPTTQKSSGFGRSSGIPRNRNRAGRRRNP